MESLSDFSATTGMVAGTVAESVGSWIILKSLNKRRISMRTLFLSLLLCLLNTAAWAETVAQISVCPKEYAQCSPRYATSFYTIPVETKFSSGCYMPAMQEMAKMALLDPNRDTLVVVCVEK